MLRAGVAVAILLSGCAAPPLKPASPELCRAGESPYFLRLYEGPGFTTSAAMPSFILVDRNGTAWQVRGSHHDDGHGDARRGHGNVTLLRPETTRVSPDEVRRILDAAGLYFPNQDYNITHAAAHQLSTADLGRLCHLALLAQASEPRTDGFYIVDAGQYTLWFDTARGASIQSAWLGQEWPRGERLYAALHEFVQAS